MKDKTKEIGNLYNKGIKKGIEETSKEFQEDEIKEILDNIKDKWEDYYAQDIVSGNDLKQLLDYITNLQTIEQQYNALLSENAELENRIKELEQISEEHRELNGNLRTANSTLCEVEDFMYNQAKEYKTRNEKATEYINKAINNKKWVNDNFQDIYGPQLLEILQGKE